MDNNNTNKKSNTAKKKRLKTNSSVNPDTVLSEISRQYQKEVSEQFKKICEQELFLDDEDFDYLTKNLLNFYSLDKWTYDNKIYNVFDLEKKVLESRIKLTEIITNSILVNGEMMNRAGALEQIDCLYLNTGKVALSRSDICEEIAISPKTFERNLKDFLSLFSVKLKESYENGGTLVKFVVMANKSLRMHIKIKEENLS